MASITKYQGPQGIRYKAVVRRKGYATQTKTFPTKKLADGWATTQEEAIAAGRAGPSAEGRNKTLADLLDVYMDADTGRDPSKVDRLSWFRRQLGERKLSELGGQVLKAVKHTLATEERLNGKRRAGSTVNRYMTSLSAALEYGKDIGWLNANPARGIKRTKEHNTRTRWLRDEERTCLLEATRHPEAPPWLYPLVVLALSTGARRGVFLGNPKTHEIGLRWSDVDVEASRIYVERTKNEAPQVLVLLAPALEAIKAWRSTQKVRRLDNDRVFAGVSYYDLDRPWQAAVERAGIEQCRFHDLRHSCASYLAQAGVPQRTIMEALGHKTLAASQRYMHLSTEHVQAALEKAMENKL